MKTTKKILSVFLAVMMAVTCFALCLPASAAYQVGDEYTGCYVSPAEGGKVFVSDVDPEDPDHMEIEAVPNPGYIFVGWYHDEDLEDTDARIYGDIEYNLCVYTAVFEKTNTETDPEALFNEARNKAIIEIHNMELEDDSDACLALIDYACDDVYDLEYDSGCSLEDNLDKISSIVERLEADLAAQRAADAANNPSTDDPTGDPTDEPNTPAANPNACPVCGATRHEYQWVGMLHQIFFSLKYLVNEVLIPFANMIKG